MPVVIPAVDICCLVRVQESESSTLWPKSKVWNTNWVHEEVQK
jgi:hypothetical protein